VNILSIFLDHHSNTIETILGHPGGERDSDFFSLKKLEKEVEPSRDALKLK